MATKKKTYKDDQAISRQKLKPRYLPFEEAAKLPGFNMGPGRRRIRNMRFRTSDRAFTRPGKQIIDIRRDKDDPKKYEVLSRRKFPHVVMDRRLEREKSDPALSNHDKNKMRAAQRKAHRAFLEASKAQEAGNA